MFLTMQEQEALVAKKLATKKTCGNFVTYKYHRRVMYDYLWEKHPELLECRGHTYDIRTGELVLAAPKKSFNYLELDTWKDIPLDTVVLAFRKWNGFMASARIVDGELLVATTGTTNPETSQYVGWARREIEKLNKSKPVDNYTKIYEIVVPEDPHIVDDGVFGAIPLMFRRSDSGKILARGNPLIVTLGELLELAKTEKHEGWMVYDSNAYASSDPTPSTCKIKTDYYVGKKKLMRASQAKASSLFSNKIGMNQFIASLPDQWHHLAYNIQRYIPEDVWLASTDQDRRALIEQLESKYYG